MRVHRLADGRWEFDSGEIRGDRIRRLFETKAAADALMRKTRDLIEKENRQFVLEWLSIDTKESIEILRYRRAVLSHSQKVDWAKGLDLHVAHLVARKTTETPTSILAEYISRKRKAGREKGYIDRLERELAQFLKRNPGLRLSEYTDRHVDAFLDAINAQGVTRKNRIRDISGLFSFGIKRKVCNSNPALLTEAVKIIRKRTTAFSLQEIAVILWVTDRNPDWDLMSYVTFNLFGSARACEALRLDWADYVEDESLLIFEAAATKPNQERVTEDLPFVLVDWIHPYVKKKGPMAPVESTVEWRRRHYLIPAIQKILPDFNWIHNGLRKTSISVDCAITNDIKAVAEKHGTSPEMVRRNYRAVIRKSIAPSYLQMTRANIAAHLNGLVPNDVLNAWELRYPKPLPSSVQPNPAKHP